MLVKRIEHIAIATRKLGEVKRVFEDLLGLRLAYEEIFPQYSTRMAMYPVGDTFLEIIEGTEEKAEVEGWIREKGEGLYHICLEVDDIDAAFSELRAKNVRLLNDKPIAGHANSRIFFVDARATADLLIEFVELPSEHANEHPTVATS